MGLHRDSSELVTEAELERIHWSSEGESVGCLPQMLVTVTRLLPENGLPQLLEVSVLVVSVVFT